MAITKEQIDALKQEHGKIFKVTPVPGIDIIYKPLSRGVYMDIMAKSMEGSIGDPERETVKLCIVNEVEDSIFDERGGIASVVYEEIMKVSGFVVVESEEL